jgi:hypothetical protein
MTKLHSIRYGALIGTLLGTVCALSAHTVALFIAFTTGLLAFLALGIIALGARADRRTANLLHNTTSKDAEVN